MLTKRSLGVVLQAAVILSLSTALFAGPAVQPATLEGVVRAPTGEPLPSVWVHPVGAKNKAGITTWVRTDGEGRFTIARPAGTHVTLRLVAGESSLKKGIVRKLPTNVRRLEIEMDPGPMLVVRITDYVSPPKDERYARATWQEADGARRTRYAPIGRKGLIRFVGVPEKVDIELWAVAAANKPVHVTKLRAIAKTQPVASMAGETITGKVLVKGNGSMKRVRVSVQRYRGFKAGHVTLDPSGQFVVRNLPPGTYTVSAQFTSGAISLPKRVVTKTNSAPITLDLR